MIAQACFDHMHLSCVLGGVRTAGVVDTVSALKIVEDVAAGVNSILAADSSTRNQSRQSAPPEHSAPQKGRMRHPGEFKVRMWSRDQHGSWNTSQFNGHWHANSAIAMPARRNRLWNQQSKGTHVQTVRTKSAVSKKANGADTIQVITV